MNKRTMWFWGFGLVVVTVLSRWIPHPANFTPVIGLALFSGACLPPRARWVLPLVAMLVSDLVLGFHWTMWSVYGSLAALAWFSSRALVAEKFSWARLSGSAVAGSVFFFVLTNSAVWLEGVLYPLTLSGWAAALVAGIPFFPATLASSLIYSVTLFGLWGVLLRASSVEQAAHR